MLETQDFERRWRSAQGRILSALRLGEGGPRTLQPIQRHPLPPRDASNTVATVEETGALKARLAHAPSGREAASGSGSGSASDAVSAEETREESLAGMNAAARRHRHDHGHDHDPGPPEYSDPILEIARSARTGGRGRHQTLGDPHRSWGRGWGSATATATATTGSGRRAIGVRGALDWVGRVVREDDDARREGSRRRLLRSDLSSSSLRMAARGRRAASVESRLDPARGRRAAARVSHEYDRYDRSEGFADYRDDESGALLVEFNDGADGEIEGREAPGVEAASAGSGDSGDTSQEGEDMVRPSHLASKCIHGS